MIHSFKNRDIIAINDFTKEEILSIISLAREFKAHTPSNLLNGCLLASCFYEPSTRTRISFESAIMRLGGQSLGFSDSSTTSVKKGESLHDTMKMIESYADVIVIRHPLEGAAQWAADSVSIPVINAGDGANQHPTQTFLDLLTIQETQDKLDGLNIALVGDLKYGRTAHSLAYACTHFNIRLYFVAPPSLEMPREVCNELREKGVKFSFHQSIEEILPKVDILYVTRLQEERFIDRTEYTHAKKFYTLKATHLQNAKPNMKVLHPLPMVGEIDSNVAETPHAHWFPQATNGLYIRQALLGLVLGKIN